MKQGMVLALALAMVVHAHLLAAAPQDTSSGSGTSSKKRVAAKKSAPTVSTQLSEMKRAIEAQQQQILQLMNQVQSRDAAIQQLQQQVGLVGHRARPAKHSRRRIPQFHKLRKRNRTWPRCIPMWLT